MDHITETRQVSDALAAKSTTTTLDELRKKGKQRVKVIRATDIAAMITETVFRVLQDAENLSDDDRQEFVERSKAEFAKVVRVRRAEAAEHETRQQQLEQVTQELTRVTQELAEARSGDGQAPAGEAPSSDLLMRMMSEMANMKAELANRPAAAEGGGGGGGGGGDMAAALEKITASLDSRLDKMGRKMGISSAVEGAEVKYDSLFNDDTEATLESNMGDVQVKRKTGGGIAGNLERLKKLKGGG